MGVCPRQYCLFGILVFWLAGFTSKASILASSDTFLSRLQQPKNGHKIWSTVLHATGTLDSRRRLGQTNGTESYFKPHHNVLYASIPDLEHPDHRHNRELRAFYRNRHLSRHERNYREKNLLDLHLDWNGQYDDEFDERSGILASRNDTTTVLDGGRKLLSLATTSGGQMNNYQSVPLSQGYGTHFASVWVGSPTPQRKTVIVDTGSHYTAFPCSDCRNCGGHHHTDPYFDPSKSATFRELQCDECQDGVLCTQGKCRFRQAYTEGSSWDAVQVEDLLYCGGTDVLDSVNPTDENYQINFMFGCEEKMR